MSDILIVDDKEANLYYLEVLLRGHGHRVQRARHGAEALVLARRQAPAVVISDLLMPVMDGYTLLRHWKADPKLSAIPFIVYTATYTEAEDEMLALEMGADAFILKPAEPEIFIQRLEQVRAATPRLAKDGSDGQAPQLLEAYAQTLIRKLEERSLQLEQANRELRADIAKRREAETALKTSEERFRLLARATNDAIWDWDIRAGTRWWGAGFTSLFGYEVEDIDANQSAWEDLIHPEDRESVLSSLRQVIESQDTAWAASYRFRRADQRWAWVEDKALLLRGDDGTVARMVGGLSDVSSRLALEEQVRKSQRLEALGHLTGGVAHDFNNLLTVVLGNAHSLVESLESQPQQKELAAMIVSAAERGANLTRQLLTFARRQSLSPRPVSLKQTVDGLAPLLQRLLGESVELHLQLDNDLPPALVDAGQLEHAILNLCVNARDAMPTGGALKIDANVEHIASSEADAFGGLSGDCLVLEVADTGCGIHAADMERIFEPFFSTKAEGKGSGLGLAMVYGFVGQSGGAVTVESSLGVGSRFKLYLPIASDDSHQELLPGDKENAPGGQETIMLVEDDILVREFAKSQLENLGYRVLAVRDGERALALLEQGEHPALLFTDLTMPGIGGHELARLAKQRLPRLRVLYTTGYSSRNHGDSSPVLEADVLLLQKPYRRADLASFVRRALGTD